MLAIHVQALKAGIQAAATIPRALERIAIALESSSSTPSTPVEDALDGVAAAEQTAEALEQFLASLKGSDEPSLPYREPAVWRLGVMYETEVANLHVIERQRPEGIALLVLINADAHDEPPRWQELGEIEPTDDGWELQLAEGTEVLQGTDYVTWVAVDTRHP
jgi:hypothetical protein